MEHFKDIKPKLICIVEDESVGLKGYLVIDSLVNNSSCGGIRLHKKLSVDELKGLAYGMTLKYAFNSMPQGGAKAGIVTDIDMAVEEKQLLLNRFAEIIQPYMKSGFYHPGPDLGISQENISIMRNHIGIKTNRQSKGKGYLSGYNTALAVMIGIEAACDFLQIKLPNSTIAVEGFGSVGTSLATLLFARGVKVISISTSKGALYDSNGLNIPELCELAKKHGDMVVEIYDKAEKISKKQLLELDVDILSPCAMSNTINNSNVQNIKAQIICPGSNNPITEKTELYLYKAGKVVIPDFTVNGGGVMGNKIEITGIDKHYIENFMRNTIKYRLIEILKISAVKNKVPSFYAKKYSLQQHKLMQSDNRKITIKGIIYKIAYTVFMSGIVPNFILKRLAPFYFNCSLKRKIDRSWKKYMNYVQIELE